MHCGILSSSDQEYPQFAGYCSIRADVAISNCDCDDSGHGMELTWHIRRASRNLRNEEGHASQELPAHRPDPILNRGATNRIASARNKSSGIFSSPVLFESSIRPFRKIIHFDRLRSLSNPSGRRGRTLGNHGHSSSVRGTNSGA